MPTSNKALRGLQTRLLAAVCLLLFFALGLRTIKALSPTNDEPAHILRGYVLRNSGDLQYQTGHAPLSHRMIGLLLAGERSAPALKELPSGTDGERLELASELLWQGGVDVDRFLFLARLPILWSGIILGGLIGSWALLWHGRGAFATVLVLFAGEPNLLASATLATTDFLTVVTYFGTVYAWWRYYRVRAGRWWLMAALFLGLALATKLTAVLLLPVLFLLTLLFWRRAEPIWRPFAALLALIPAAALVLWLVYGLQIDRLSGWPSPMPAAAYIISWQTVLEHVARGHRAFFLGDLSGEGWLSYFPVTFLIKTPLVTMLLLAIGLVTIATHRRLWRTTAFLLLPAGALFAAAMTSRLNIGYRHILPMIPFLLVLASTAELLLRRRPFTQLLLVLALAWYVIAAVRQQPQFLAYFNEIVGGTQNGHRFLGDSNLDWGQDLKILSAAIAEEDPDWVISYAGVADPDYYGIDRELLLDHEQGGPPFAVANPQPGRYVISANHWQGILEDADTFDWFRRQEDVQVLGGSLLVYDVDSQDEGAWAAHCIDPAPLLTPEEAENVLGVTGLRHIWFDCRQSWVLPAGNTPGWYITPQMDELWPAGLLAPDSTSRLRQVYRHRAAAGSPSYDVYRWDGGELAPQPQKLFRRAADESGQPVDLPYAVNGLAELKGYMTEGAQWITLWQALGTPQEPLSLRAHLYGEGGRPPAVGDALGYSTEQWRSGDAIWQRHVFDSLQGADYLETGLYNFLTLEQAGEMLRLPYLP